MKQITRTTAVTRHVQIGFDRSICGADTASSYSFTRILWEKYQIRAWGKAGKKEPGISFSTSDVLS